MRSLAHNAGCIVYAIQFTVLVFSWGPVMKSRNRILNFLFIACLILPRNNSAQAETSGYQLATRPMDFALVQSGSCQETCTQWISAEGKITAGTPELFRTFLKKLGGRKLPVVFQSYGGNVDAALSIGRMIRTAGLETAVGRTQLKDCPMLDPRCQEQIIKDGWSTGEVRAGGAYCFSACPFALAGGKVRSATVGAAVGVHQITSVSAKTTVAMGKKLSKYFNEMGVSREVFAMMALATPKGMYHIRMPEALRSGVITKVLPYGDEPGYVSCGPNTKSVSLCDEFEDPRSHESEPRDVGEDPSCALVNRAYMRTVNSGRYQVNFFHLEADGNDVFDMETRFVDRSYFTRRNNEPWVRRSRPMLLTVRWEAGRKRPVIQGCVHMGNETVDGIAAMRFKGEWQRSAFSASTEIWISKENLTYLKAIRRFPENSLYPLGNQVVVEKYDLDRNVLAPDLSEHP
ncbi:MULTISPECIES: hypothetical protein [unclassified Neorhizobium]|uniref:COG3904 family protein n=1 Tax=unclassified Neorhizobium TaxID=2629175 RepID=UPI001FF1AE08|nr:MULTISPECIES: hypothetical protein [unclassified Neorhizobium]MCJ9669262.1 hypothetical protein [Neorhizobium sp. SHOUNA12B]MCJ9742874.1 hypothetical protein [Neorhizobium sp. SHOUNA12A]